MEIQLENHLEINTDEPLNKIADDNKFTIEKIECTDCNFQHEVSLSKVVVPETFIKSELSEDIWETKNDIQIIPNKMKCINNNTFITLCKFSKLNDEKNGQKYYLDHKKCLDFNFLYFQLVYTKNKNINKQNFQWTKKVLITADILGLNLLNVNFQLFNGSKFFSNFYIIKINDHFIIFLVVYNSIFLIKINNDEKKENQEINLDSLRDNYESKLPNSNYEIIFKKEFTTTEILLYLSHQEVNNEYEFYLLIKPSQKILICKCSIEDNCKVTMEERAIDYLSNSNSITGTNESLNISRVVESNSSEIIFYDKNSQKIFLMNKQKMGLIRVLHDKNKEFYKKLKNYLIMVDKNSKDSNLYFITDEVIKNDCLCIKLWSIKNSNSTNMGSRILTSTNSFENVYCEKIQSVYIKLKIDKDKSEQGLGNYIFTLINDTYFALNFLDYEEIFIFNLKNNKMNPSKFLIENITDLKFNELPGYLFDYQILCDKKLELNLYQEIDFLKYEIELHYLPTAIKCVNSKVFTKNYKNIIPTSEANEVISKNKKKNLKGKTKSESNNSNFLNSSLIDNKNTNNTPNQIPQVNEIKSIPQNNVGNISHCSHDSNNESIPQNSNSIKEKNNSIKKSKKNIDESQNIIMLPNSVNFVNSFTPLNNEKEKDNDLIFNDFKKSITENFVNNFEEKLDKIINAKLNLFADTLNNNFKDIFSFMKQQTGELEEIRKKNNEAMANLTNLIIKSHENINSGKNSNSTNQINTNSKLTNNFSYATVNPAKNMSYNNPTNNNTATTSFGNFNFHHYMNLNMNKLNSGQFIHNPWIYNSGGQIIQEINSNKNNPNLQSNSTLKQNAITFIPKSSLQNNTKKAIGNKPDTNSYSLINSGNQFYPNYNYQQFLLNSKDSGKIPSNLNYLYNPFYNMNRTINNNICEIPTDNKYKEDEIALQNLEKKLSEIKTNEDLIENNFVDGNISLDFNNQNNKQAINYSSDISSGNLESDIDLKKENEYDKTIIDIVNNELKIEDKIEVPNNSNSKLNSNFINSYNSKNNNQTIDMTQIPLLSNNCTDTKTTNLSNKAKKNETTNNSQKVNSISSNNNKKKRNKKKKPQSKK